MKRIDKMVWIRTLVLIFALINQTLVIMGWSPLPFSDEQVEHALSLVFTVLASIWGWWKNNSFTHNAQKADEYLKDLRNR